MEASGKLKTFDFRGVGRGRVWIGGGDGQTLDGIRFAPTLCGRESTHPHEYSRVPGQAVV